MTLGFAPRETMGAGGTEGPRRRPHVLVIAYSCSPYRGSEPGAGWSVVRAISVYADCVVLVEASHLDACTEAAGASGALSFVGVARPASVFTRRPHRIFRFLVYLAWLRAARVAAMELMSRVQFDLVYHATYSVYWLPTPARTLGLPYVLGPVGGAVTAPACLISGLGLFGLADELFDRVCTRCAELWPATRASWEGAARILVQNEHTRRRLPPKARDRAVTLNHALFATVPAAGRSVCMGYVLAVSPFETRKGSRLLLGALARTPKEIRLVLAGDGPERALIERQSRRLDVSDRIYFWGKCPARRCLSFFHPPRSLCSWGCERKGDWRWRSHFCVGRPPSFWPTAVRRLSPRVPPSLSGYGWYDRARLRARRPG